MPEEFIISFYITHQLSPSRHMTCQRLTPDRLDSAFRLRLVAMPTLVASGGAADVFDLFSSRTCVSPPYTVIIHLKILSPPPRLLHHIISSFSHCRLCPPINTLASLSLWGHTLTFHSLSTRLKPKIQVRTGTKCPHSVGILVLTMPYLQGCTHTCTHTGSSVIFLKLLSYYQTFTQTVFTFRNLMALWSSIIHTVVAEKTSCFAEMMFF